MTYNVLLDRRVLKQISKLSDRNKDRIKDALLRLSDFPDDLDVKKLVGSHNKYRIRVGKFRILVELNRGEIAVFSILPRKEAYKKK